MEEILYPAHFEEKIGFSQVREMLQDECISVTGKEIIKGLSFSSNYQRVIHELSLVSEFMSILIEGLPFPAQDYLDLIPVLQRLRTPGSSIAREELHDLRVSMTTIIEALNFLKRSEPAKLPRLKEMAEQVIVTGNLIPSIEKILDPKGNVRDHASPELAKIRKEIKAKILANEKAISSLINLARTNGWVSADAEPTLREGRLVLPVQASHKRRIRGLIHDESATGQTVYLEPDECFELNNEVRNLENAEKREIIRILTLFTDDLRPELANLVQAHLFIARIDAIRARARFCLRIGGQVPVLKEYPVFHWKTARHPLLLISHQSKGKTVVPLDLDLDSRNRVLVISGPNAGGKSVCLKTAGLLQYMLQCGLPVPMDSASEAGLFKQIFLEIGDEQSLENDLSTYSSHLLHIRYFIEHCDAESLFLIDEFGAGTDPSLGGAIAEATLEKLSEKRPFGVITTHYSNLKTMAGKVDGIINGAMLFDTDGMKPLYQLVIGNPGSSFTYEIARKIGFPEEVIQAAMGKTGKTHLDFERQLQALDLEKKQLEKKKEEFTVADDFLDELIQRYETMKSDLEKSRKEILEKARVEATKMLDDSNRLIERTIKEIRESAAEKVRTKQAREKLSLQKQQLEKQVQKEPEPAPQEPKKKFKRGDWVKIAGQDRIGLVQKIKGSEAFVDFNGIRFTVRTDQLEPSAPPKKAPEARAYGKSSYGGDLQEKTAHFKLTLDVRGKRAEEALHEVTKYLDDAYLLRIHEVDILHGKGDGILRKLIRELLAKTAEVESFSDEHIERGGSGITKVILK